MIDHNKANEARKKIMNLVRTLSPYFVGRHRKHLDDNGAERDEVIFLMTIAMVAS